MHITVKPERRHDGVARYRLTLYPKREHWKQARRYREGFASATEASKRERELATILRTRGMDGLCDALFGVEKVQTTGAATGTLQTAITEFLAHKKAAGRRDRTRNNLRLRLAKLTRHFPKASVRSVAAADLQDLIDSGETSARDRINDLIVWRNFFRWCQRRGKRADNPMAAVDAPRAPRGLPVVAGPWRVARLMASAWYYGGTNTQPGSMLGYALLSFFSGIRPEESVKLGGWERVNFERGFVALDEHVTKVARIRHSRISNDLLRCLAALKKLGQPPARYRRKPWDAIRTRAGLAGDAWAVDIGRHTYASSTYATTHDEAEISADMGNSVDVLRKHYLNKLVTTEQAQAWQRVLGAVAGKLERCATQAAR